MADKIRKILRNAKTVLFADPKRLYKEDRELIKKPFYFKGTNGKAVLLVHGWTSVPYEVRRLGQYLNENGYTACGPMLSGHGTVPKDLESVDWKDWLRDITLAYEDLKKTHSEVYVAGTSIGACLAVILAKNKPDVAGLVLMAMPYKIRFERIALALARFLNYFKKYNQKFYPPTFGSKTTITRLIAYQTYPIGSAIETFELVKVCRKELPKAVQPSFIIQSLSDHVVAKKSLEIIYGKIGSKIKKKKYYNYTVIQC